MASEDTGKISVTLKGGAGYDAPWIVLRADTPEEMVTLIEGIRGSDLDVAVRAAAHHFQTVVSGSPEAAAQAILGGTLVSDTGQEMQPSPPLSGPYTPGPGAPAGNGVGNYPAPQSFGLPQQLPPALQPNCPTCGGPTQFRVDNNSTPPRWKGWFCINAPRGGPKHDVTWVK